MKKNKIFQDTFYISGIMCFEGCGNIIQFTLNNLDELKQKRLIPQDAQIVFDSEPQMLGVHRLFISLHSDDEGFQSNDHTRDLLSDYFKQKIRELDFSIDDAFSTQPRHQSTKKNLFNLGIGALGIIALVAFASIFTPSLLLTMALAGSTLIVTGIMARAHIYNFIRNLKHKRIATMATPITLGWLAALSHSMYNAFTAISITNLSFVFMNFVAPIVLLGLVNAMDILKTLMIKKSQRLHMSGLKSLLPEMKNTYATYLVENDEKEYLNVFVKLRQCYETQLQHIISTSEKHKRIKEVDKVITLSASAGFHSLERLYETIIDKLIESRIANGEGFHYKLFFPFWYQGQITVAELCLLENKQAAFIRLFEPESDCKHVNLPVDKAILKRLNQAMGLKIKSANSPVLINKFDYVRQSEINAQIKVPEFEYFNVSESSMLASSVEKKHLQEGMILKIESGDSFPVDGIVLSPFARIDSSVLTGETEKYCQQYDAVPAGAVNLGQEVLCFATSNSYNSMVNQIVYRANRDINQNVEKKHRRFTYLYTAAFMLGLVLAIAMPIAFGVLSAAVVLQNAAGILFAICPCMVVVAAQLPKLISVFSRARRNIFLRSNITSDDKGRIHTVIFDKTGTLTTGESEVHSSHGISHGLWEKLTSLEKMYGEDHPIAKALIQYCAPKKSTQEFISTLKDKNSHGMTGIVDGVQIQIGNARYLQDNNITLPSQFAVMYADQLKKGYTPVFVAQNQKYQGVVFIKHQVRPTAITTLRKLRDQGVRIIMLTGDTPEAAQAFNAQYDEPFFTDDIVSGKTPAEKEEYLQQLLHDSSIDKTGIWFVGDGLNDAPCARRVSEAGGVSCAISETEKAAKFCDVALDGRLDYLLIHQKMNHFLHTVILQNKLLLTMSPLASIAFVIGFAAMGTAIPVLIPMLLMVLTTVLTLLNSSRVQMMTDNAMSQATQYISRIFSSNLFFAALICSNALLMGGSLVQSLVVGSFVFPGVIFTAGIVASVASACVLSGGVLLTVLCLTAIPAFLNTKRQRSNASRNANKIQTKKRQINPDTTEIKPVSKLSTQPIHSSILFRRKSVEMDSAPEPSNDLSYVACK